MLGHYVFFSLHDASPDAVKTLIDSAQTLLAHQEGIVFFAIGSRTEDLTRAVNDTQFDVGLQIVFSDRSAHDRYQEGARAPRVHRAKQRELVENSGF